MEQYLLMAVGGNEFLVEQSWEKQIIGKNNLELTCIILLSLFKFSHYVPAKFRNYISFIIYIINDISSFWK